MTALQRENALNNRNTFRYLAGTSLLKANPQYARLGKCWFVCPGGQRCYPGSVCDNIGHGSREQCRECGLIQ